MNVNIIGSVSREGEGGGRVQILIHITSHGVAPRFVLNRFPCSIIIGMLLRTHDFNSSQFATRHPAEGVGFLSLALGGDGGGLGSALGGG